MEESVIRSQWKMGASCQIYSNSKKKWFGGEVAQIFTDEEGEWLEIRYDKSMSKQVQRYSSDIRPNPDELKKKKKKKNDNVPFPDPEMKAQKEQFVEKERQLRQSWDKGDEVEIFSNTHQEWFLGEIVDIIKDDEGEWLNCVWARSNGEAMSKQVQRFSTDVRPVQDDDASTGSDSEDRPSPKQTNTSGGKPQSQTEKVQLLAQKIAQRKNNFRRRAPPFSRTLRASTFSYPASSSARRARKLLDLEEGAEKEKNQVVPDQVPSTTNGKSSHNRGPKKNIHLMSAAQVREFITHLGKAYTKYAPKFKMSGAEFAKCTEQSLSKLVPAKLHRAKILLEVTKNLPHSEYDHLFASNVEVYQWTSHKVREWCAGNHVLAVYAQKFFNHGVDGMLLFELDAKDLTTIGVKKMHQQRVLDVIAKFAKQNFPSDAIDDEKDQENNGGTLQLQEARNSVLTLKRASVADIDVATLEAINGGMEGASDNNHDAIILTMGDLLLQLGQMFKNSKVQALTTLLQQQLTALQRSTSPSNHVNTDALTVDTTSLPLNGGQYQHEHEADKELIARMQDRVDTSPTGVDAAWLATQEQAKGHKRRSSLPMVNMNQLQADEDDDDQDAISDIE